MAAVTATTALTGIGVAKAATSSTSSPPLIGAQNGIATGPTVLWESDTDFNRDMDGIAATGATWIRTDLTWSGAEPQKGQYNWKAFDRLVNGANARGIKVIALVSYSPAWARPAGTTSDKYPPVNPDDYANFLKAAVARYSPLGVNHWEIWNEPNQDVWWGPKPNVAAYTTLLKKAYVAIKGVDPNATVISAGLAPAPDAADGRAISQTTFVNGIYANGGKGYFDALGMHPYSGADEPLFPMDYNPFYHLQAIHQIMVAQGDGNKLIYSTEYGAPTSTGMVDQATQADYVRQTYTAAAQFPWLGPITYFNWRDLGTDPSAIGDNHGLVKIDFTAKQALAAFTQMMHTPVITNPDTTPATVTGLTAFPSATGMTVHITTDETTEATVDYGPGGYGTSTPIDPTATTHDIVLSGLACGTNYKIRVRVIDGGANVTLASTSQSTTACGSADVTPPVITGPTVMPFGTTTSMKFSTNETSNAIVEYGTTSSYGSTKSGGAATTGFNVTLNSLANGTTYHYRLKVTDLAGNLTVTPDATFQTTPAGDSVPPAVPTGVQATTTATKVTVTWTPNTDSDLAEYQVLRNSSYVTDIPVGTTSWVDPNATAGTLYRYSIRAVDTSGNTSAASAVSSVIAGDVTPPTPPAATAVSYDSKVWVKWTASTASDLAGYHLYRDGSVIATLAKGATSYQDLAVVNGSTYSYALDAFDTNGNTSAPGAVATGAPVDKTPPAAPTGLSATAGERTATVNWAANTEPDLAGYKVFRNGGLVGTVPAGTLTFTLGGLTNGTTYTFTLRAFDQNGNTSPLSTGVTATPVDLPPAAPTGLAATPGDKKVDLLWAPNGETDLAGYRVLRNGVQVAQVAKTVTTWRDTAVTNGTSYSYSVVAYDAKGNVSAASAPVTAIPVSALTALTISNVVVSNVTTNSAGVTWGTNRPTTAVVSYGATTSYGSQVSVTVAAATQGITLPGLHAGIAYHFQVRASDGTSSVTSPDTTFTTPDRALAVDEFNGSALDSMWTLTDTAGGTSVAESGGLLAINVPAGAAHDVTITQDAIDTDTKVDTRLVGIPTAPGASTGFVFAADANNSIRVGIRHDGTSQHLTATQVTPTGSTVLWDIVRTTTPNIPLQVQRTGTTWTVLVWASGAWQPVGSFTNASSVHQVGFFVTTTGATAYTGQADYLHIPGQAS
jgi:fibronectin type 3 domain-containing protein